MKFGIAGLERFGVARGQFGELLVQVEPYSLALVIDQETADDHNIRVGDTVTLDLGQYGDDPWPVIGIFQTVFDGGFFGAPIYAPLAEVYAVTKQHNRGTQILVRTANDHPATVAGVAARLQTLYEARNRDVDLNNSGTTAEDREFADSQYAININIIEP